MSNELWTDGPDEIMNAPTLKRRGRPSSSAGSSSVGRFIGCPMWWFAWVYPVVRGRNGLAVALYIYRLRVIQHSRTIKVSNTRLLDELGINRYAKYRTLNQLARAGIITIKHPTARSLEIIFHQRRAKAKRSR